MNGIAAKREKKLLRGTTHTWVTGRNTRNNAQKESNNPLKNANTEAVEE